jgi:hypothetical protein
LFKGNQEEEEPSIEGLQRALTENVAKNSFAYIFTDAPAKDHGLETEVLPILQKKQIKVSFIITGNCNVAAGRPGTKVFQKIASASEGQVLEVERLDIKKALLAIALQLDPKFQAFKSISQDNAGSVKDHFEVDQSVSKVAISMAGKDSTIKVEDENGEKIETIIGFSSTNVRFESFDVKSSKYIISATSSSEFTIRVGGICELKIDFGFSTNIPNEPAETSYQPLEGHKNILSIFVSDKKLVKCLIKAILLPVINGQSLNGEKSIEIKLHRGNRLDMFLSDSFDIPTEIFKIQVFGYDSKGNVIERLISSGIVPVSGSNVFFFLLCNQI